MSFEGVEILNLEASLGTVKNKVALVGVELEGGWVTLPQGVVRLEHDGSVFDGRVPPGVKYIGELPVGPTVPAGIGELMKANYPQKVNYTCGMHVHMSFNHLWHFQMLMVPQYPATVIHCLTEWAKRKNFRLGHPIWTRLKGESKYCVHEFYPDLQAGVKSKNHNMDMPGQRYTSIHYCGRLNTIECRVLPMISETKRAIEAVEQLIHITNACIYELSKRHPRDKQRESLSATITLPTGLSYRESITEIV